ncbi:MAG: efflux RND transporter periplasmic adaptor subunit [Pseudohongiellaceae bacterium]
MSRPPLPRRMLRTLLPLLIVSIGVALTALMVLFREEPDSTPVEERVIPVETMTVERSDITFGINSQGTVQPRTETMLVAEVSGRVNSVSAQFEVGGFFNEGEVLLRIDSADYQVAVDQARAALLTAEAQLAQEQAQADQAAREWDLSGRPREEAPPLSLRTPFLREAEARVMQAESELQRARRQLERTTVRAPYDALVREKNADVGQYLNTGAQIARVFATDHAEVRLPLSDPDLAWLDLPRPGEQVPDGNGTPVTLEATLAGRSQQWQGHIVRTEGVIDSTSRMLYAVARVEDPYARQDKTGGHAPLRTGTFVTARLQGRSADNVVSLPHQALHDATRVLVMDAERRLRIREVNIIRTDTQYAYIDDGLDNNDQVIVSPIQVPVDGMRVNPVAGTP